ncbi:MAG: TolC family protein [Tannerella sp.]|jgi:cobalt-zinc-cadmium efflux system outer membrane protein|nr:TolC family protein [Tannerella sp.]
MKHLFIIRHLSFNKRYLLFVTALLCICRVVYSQELERTQQSIDYKTYMDMVWKQNLSYAAEKLNIDIAEAGIKAAKVFNDPSLSVEYADNDDRRLKMGRSVSVELSKTFSAGKRNANIELAQSEKDLNEALLEDYFHRLRAEATLAYLEALKQSELYSIKENACSNIHRLATSDSIRFALGKITQVDAIQSKVEAEIASNELAMTLTELYNAYASLGLWTGVFDKDVIHLPSERLLMKKERTFDSGKLLQTALENRADLAAAMKNVEVAGKTLKVTQRERNMDFDLVLGYNYNTEVRNEIAPAPRFNGVTVGISIPLKFSNTNKGAVQVAGFRKRQAELNYRQAELEVQTSVMQSLRLYLSSLEQVKRYEDGLLEDAQSVLEGKIYSYERGETSRLEALIAQQTYDELRAAYIEALFNSVAALIDLERNAGIWDIEL